VRVQSLARLLFTLLAFQLAVGMQVGVAYASTVSTAPMPKPLASAHVSSAIHEGSNDACAMHNASSATHDASTSTHNANASSQTSAHTKAPLQKSADKHDCCKSSGCQCQCGNVPLAFNLPAMPGAAVTTNVRPLRATRSAFAPSDTHFRPPIAS
jgi:hypothetical protein